LLPGADSNADAVAANGAVGGQALPYWRLSGFYFFYFSVLGALVPFWGLYLKSLNYSAKEIGIVSAMLAGTRVVAPNLWGWLGDKTGQRLRIIRVGSFMACVCFAGILVDQRFGWLVWVVAAYTFFWNAVLAQFEVTTLAHLGRQPQRYSLIRLWGSVGFILVVVGLGFAFDHLSIRYLPLFIFFFLAMIWVSSLSIVERRVEHGSESGQGFWQILLQKPVLCFLLASFLLQVSFGPYYTFYSVYLETYHYSRTVIGFLWALGVIAEVLIFFVMHRLLPTCGVRNLLLFSLGMAVLRWWLIACYAESVVILFFAQLLHAFTFGTAHAVAIELIRSFFGGRHQGQGQAVYSAASFGAGGAVGAAVAGLLWDASAVLTFAVSSGAAALALLIAWVGVTEAAHKSCCLKAK